jgi:diguanylate cyclase (GGDEF)-like protein
MIMLDIDHFKEINDTYGHDAGDDALRCIARTLQDNIREVEIAVRLGGEEFGILLPNTKVTDAVVLAERLRTSIAKESCILLDPGISITASIGVVAYNCEMQDLDALMRVADAAMYMAKKQGRNRVVSLN